MRRSHLVVLALAALALAVAMAPTAGAGGGAKNRKPKAKTVDVQILALNDFHGALEPNNMTINPATGGSSAIPGSPALPAGGAEYLATQVRQLEAGVKNSVVVSAGDLIGASPLLSALFHDEPTIEAMNAIGLDLNAVGNHEFDEGAAELRRMQEGGCHPTDGCADGDGFAGADFDFLAANVIDEATGRPFFAPYAVKRFQGEKVAFIGMTLEGTPSIVSPSGVAGLDFRDEVQAANALVPELRARGVESIVVLLHEGISASGGGINGCTDPAGPVVDIVNGLDDEIDAVVTGHTHRAYTCEIDGRLVTSAGSNGRLVTDIGLTIDKRTGDVTAARADNLVVRRDLLPPAADVTSLIEEYSVIAAPLRDRVIGAITESITKTPFAGGDTPAGDLIADAQLAATDDAGTGQAVVALMNPGGVRDPGFVFDSPAGTGGAVTYGEAFTVQPFGNNLVTLTLSGAQIDALLEQQFCQGGNPANTRTLAVSEGFTYAWSASAPCGAKVDPTSITLAGVPLVPGADYRVTVNSFLADGGDAFTVLTQGTNRLGGAVDIDALEAYLASAGGPVAPVESGRITTAP